MPELVTTFVRAHERMAQAVPPPEYQMRVVGSVGQSWIVEAYHAYLPSMVLVGEKWLAVDPNRPLFAGAMSAYLRLGYFKATGEFLD